MSNKNARTLSIRLDADTVKRLDDFELSTGIDAVTLGRQALKACLDYHDTVRSISFPLKLVPKSPEDIANERAQLGEVGKQKAG